MPGTLTAFALANIAWSASNVEELFYFHQQVLKLPRGSASGKP